MTQGTVRRAFLHLHHSSLKSQLGKDCERGKEDNTEQSAKHRCKEERGEYQGIKDNVKNGPGLHCGSDWSWHDWITRDSSLKSQLGKDCERKRRGISRNPIGKTG